MSTKEFNCSICGEPNAHWGSQGREYCSVCMPARVIGEFTANQSPAWSMNFKKALRSAGNKALLGRKTDGE